MRKNALIKTILVAGSLGVLLAAVAASMRCGAGVKGVHSQTLFEQFVLAGGWIVWFVLLPMSVVMVYLSVEHSLTLRRARLLPAGTGKGILEIIRQYGVDQLVSRMAGRRDLLSVAMSRAAGRSGGDSEIMKDAAAESLQEQALALFRKIEWLNLIGNVAPMVGLFGTVVGMIELFNAIVSAGGQPQPVQLAHGISVALVTTFWGLLIAIPALGVHGVFRNRIESIISDAAVEAEVLFRHMNRSAGSPARLDLVKPRPAAEATVSRPAIRAVGPAQSQVKSEHSAGKS